MRRELITYMRVVNGDAAPRTYCPVIHYPLPHIWCLVLDSDAYGYGGQAAARSRSSNPHHAPHGKQHCEKDLGRHSKLARRRWNSGLSHGSCRQ